MIICTIMALILGIVITLAYLNDDLERLQENDKISFVGLKKLNFIKGIVFIVLGITIILAWLSMITMDIKLILMALVLLIIGVILFMVLKGKVKTYKYETKKRKIVKGKVNKTANKQKVKNI